MNKNTFTQMWNQRYSEQSYAYGTAPNAFIKASLDSKEPGKSYSQLKVKEEMPCMPPN